MTTSAAILGEFAPPTVAEVDALRDRLAVLPDTVIGVTGSRSPHGIPAPLRAAWMRRLLPGAAVRIEPDTADPEGAAASRPAADAPAGPTAAEVRADPFAHWAAIPDVVRPDYLVRVAVVGPESVGKSTLSARLARHLGGRDVQEYARDAFPWADPDYRARPEHMVEICRGHRAAILEAERTADRWLFSDTEALSTLAWSELYFGAVPDGVHDHVARQEFDLFLLLDADVPWVADGTRTWEDHREPLHRRLRELLVERDLPFREISGTWEERFARALEVLEELGPPAAPRGAGPRHPDFPRRPERTAPGTHG